MHATIDAPRPQARLFCFAHAGGTARAFAPWWPLLPQSLDLFPVELPGHGWRMDEAPIGSMAALLDRLLPDVLPHADRPFALFGHSTGAKVAFELSRALVEQGRRPLHLFVAACPAFGFPAWGAGLHTRPREELVAALQRLGGTPVRVLADSKLLDLFLPVIRADFQLALEYEVLLGPALECPITAFAGARDPDIAIDDVDAWRRHTTGPFRLTRLDAQHHFVSERAAEIVGEIARALDGDGGGEEG